MAAQHSRHGDYSTRYRFNGKEQDQATGFYYYGARYYEPSLSRWLSTDPLAEKYQGFSPYNYTINNPINLVDPDGRCFKKVGEEYFPCDEADEGSTTTGAFGYEWTMSKDNGWQLTKGADTNTVNYEYNFIEASGSADYYIDRYKNHIEKYNTRPPDYYLGFGHKYRVRFKALKSKLSKAGKEWSKKTGVALQEKMNDFIFSNPKVQSDNALFKSAAYETHVPAYTESGISNLRASDLRKIMMEPDFKDSFGSSDGLMQILKMLPYVISYPEGYWDIKQNPGNIMTNPYDPK